MDQIPVFDTAAFTEEVTLDDSQYRLAFRYNFRGDFWIVDILDRENNPLAMGIKIVASYELIRRYGYRAIPPGALFATDSAELELRIGRDDLPTRIEMVYVTEDEYATV